MRRYDLGSTLFLMAVAAYVIVSGFRLGFGAWREPGPGFLAVLSGMALGGLAAIWCRMAWVARRTAAPAGRFIAEAGGARKGIRTAAALAAFALLLEPLGFPLTTLAFLIFLLRTIEPQRWGLTLALSVVTTVLCILVFQIWLQVQFPEGLLGVYTIRRWVF